MKRIFAILTVVFIFSLAPAFGDPGDEHTNNHEGSTSATNGTVSGDPEPANNQERNSD